MNLKESGLTHSHKISEMTSNIILIDGGLSSELEAVGLEIPQNTRLWTARCLLDKPELVKQAHIKSLNDLNFYTSQNLSNSFRKPYIFCFLCLKFFEEWLSDH